MRLSSAVLPLLLALATPTCAQTATGLVNPGFEDGLNGWRAREANPMSTVRPESAHDGKAGLHVEDADDVNGSSLLSSPLVVTAGQALKLSFWLKSADSGKTGIVLWFYDAERKLMPKAQPTAAFKGAADWQQITLNATAPEGATNVAIWIHTYSTAKTSLDLDEFSLTAADGTALPAAPPFAATPMRPAGTPKPTAPSVPRTSPPYVMIKVDDMKNVHPLWKHFTDFITERKIHASIGIICNSLEEDNPKYFQWVKDQKAGGLLEFWCHGYDHKQWEEGGKTLEEFKGPSLEQQTDHLHKCQALAKEKLGFTFPVFGAPFNSGDENTVKALQAVPDFKIVLYGNPKTPGGKVILDRVYQVNIENPTFRPNVEKFKEGFAQYPQRDYFVIQGHPTHWDAAGWDQFVKIIDFLQEQKAIFVTPSEYVELKHLAPQP